MSRKHDAAGRTLAERVGHHGVPMNRKQRRAAKKTQGKPRIETSGPVPQVTPYTDLAIRNLYHALNQAIALLHAEADQRPWGMDSGSWEQAYVQGRVHMAEEAVNLLDAIRTAVHMTNTMGAPLVQESKR